MRCGTRNLKYTRAAHALLSGTTSSNYFKLFQSDADRSVYKFASLPSHRGKDLTADENKCDLVTVLWTYSALEGSLLLNSLNDLNDFCPQEADGQQNCKDRAEQVVQENRECLPVSRPDSHDNNPKVCVCVCPKPHLQGH